ncbi:MAG: manno-octulosonate cytidylyltransferase [Candidatus Krumholzibacteriia bacterium]|nr:3-deoxy-manno-octulosonate cytidylyltransferase [bacterium]MCB9513226.1 3-deoxy-manno-octulosonate cytidylyltransferase [Candidatus Latescibacterota bacterium]MCB9514690.1 3-deoxy-manno-octulosonate cytidylyltransferase [Candidatus Latescibacterota bacterium]
MATLAVIPARMGSSRFPGKPLALLAGKTLIQRVCERAAGLAGVAALRVATDHPEILAHVQSLGFDARLTDGAHPSGSDRVAEAAADWTGHVLNLQGDEPLFDTHAVTALIARLEADDSLAMGTVGVPLRPTDLEAPDRVKVLRAPDGLARDFRRQLDGPPPPDCTLHLHAGIYLYRAETLARFVALPPSPREIAERLEQLRALEAGIPIWVETGEHWAPGVDTPEDLKVVAKLLERA